MKACRSTVTMLVLVVTVSLTFGDAVDNDWPRFRGPNGDGLSPAKGIPTTWSPTQNVLWSADLPKAFKIVPRDVIADKPADLRESGSPSDMQSKAFNPYSCPIVSGGKVFIASAGIRTSEHSLLCFQLSDGKLLWETPVPPGPSIESPLQIILDKKTKDPSAKTSFSHSYGYNCTTPCTDGERVYVTFGTGIMAAIDFQGKLVWTQPIVDMQGKEKMNQPIDKGFFYYLCIATSPVVYNDLVIQVMDTGTAASHGEVAGVVPGLTMELIGNRKSYIMAFSRKTGELKYLVQRKPLHSWTTPVLARSKDKSVLIHSNGAGIDIIDPNSGETIRNVNAKGISGTSSLAYLNGVVCARVAGSSMAFAIDETGNMDKNAKWTLPDSTTLGGYCSPVIVDGIMYRFGAGRSGVSKDKKVEAPLIGKLFCVEMSTGKELHVLDMPGYSNWASPVATADGYVYFATGTKSYVIKTGPKPEIVGVNDLGDYNPAPSPAVVDGKLIIRGSAKLWCIGKP